jgi:hypothetical protein
VVTLIRNLDPYPKTEMRFGAYSISLKEASSLHERLRAALQLASEDLYLEVHVPDSVRGPPRDVLGAFKTGAVELADFLTETKLAPAWLLGVTHKNVARPAERFLNFQVITGIPEEAVDEEKRRRIAEGYSKTKRWNLGLARGPLCLCYQSYEAFMDFAAGLRRDELGDGPRATC